MLKVVWVVQLGVASLAFTEPYIWSEFFPRSQLYPRKVYELKAESWGNKEGTAKSWLLEPSR